MIEVALKVSGERMDILKMTVDLQMIKSDSLTHTIHRNNVLDGLETILKRKTEGKLSAFTIGG